MDENLRRAADDLLNGKLEALRGPAGKRDGR